MKKVYLIFISLCFFVSGLFGQEQFYGEWHMEEQSMENLEKKIETTKEMLKENGTIWIMRFSADQSFYQKSNFNPQSRMDEMEGTWKTEPDELLTIFLMINGQRRPLQFYYTFVDDKMILERYDQLRTMKMIVVFKKVS